MKVTSSGSALITYSCDLTTPISKFGSHDPSISPGFTSMLKPSQVKSVL